MRVSGNNPPIMENQNENDMETGIIGRGIKGVINSGQHALPVLHELRTKCRLGGTIGDNIGFWGGPYYGIYYKSSPGRTSGTMNLSL